MELDPIELAVARARTERALFGRAEPVLVGRHEVHDTLAGGGMGMVYRGVDRDLRRKVALKVLLPDRRTDARSRERLTREATALAQLDHPNVVKIHEVIDHHGQLVIVMELVEGITLDRWLAAEPRTWREIVHVYAQAADGLAAAHAQGFVHRDFKPTNAIIGNDGRVRVLDFGLAQAASLAERADVDGVIAAPDLTSTGDIVGTLAFAAPEQLAGGEITAASDQFSFCAALHASIEGMPAFSGRDIPTRLASIQAGTVSRPRRRRPAWLRAVIARGLACKPEQRFATMIEMITELRRPRGWRRWRTPVLAAGLIGVTTGATLVLQPAAQPMCHDGAARTAEIWNDGIRTRLGALLRSTGTPNALEISQRTVATLDAYRRNWQQAHDDACTAHREHDVATPLYAQQMACLTQRLRDMRAAVAVLETTDRHETANVLEVVASLPRLSDCVSSHLDPDVQLPETPALQLRVAAIRSEISVGAAAARAGRTEQALAILRDTVRAAGATQYRPLRIEAGLAVGRVYLSTGDYDRARETLLPVRAWAIAAGDKEAAIEASARLLYVDAMQKPDISGLEHELAYVLPMSNQLADDSAAKALLLNNIGAAYQAAEQRADASRYFELARHELHGGDPVVPELAVIYRNLAMLTPDPVAREALVRHACEYLRATLGPEHPTTIEALVAYGQYAIAPSVAFQQLSLASAAYRRFHPAIVERLAYSELRRATLAAELGDDTTAIEIYRGVLELTAGSPTPELARWRQFADGERAILEAKPEQAIRALTPILAMTTNSRLWWESADHLRAAVRLGEAELLRGHASNAARYLELAVAGYDAVVAHNEDVEYPQLRARAKRLLAGVLVRQDSDRANKLLQDAQSFYRRASAADYARWLQ